MTRRLNMPAHSYRLAWRGHGDDPEHGLDLSGVRGQEGIRCPLSGVRMKAGSGRRMAIGDVRNELGGDCFGGPRNDGGGWDGTGFDLYG